jgi:uncharacterized membrane protein YhaH (DUF805 family)
VNPFTGSIDRKNFLIWNIALSLIYYVIRIGFNSTTVLNAYFVISLLLVLLLVARRLQNTGLNMWLLLAILLPLANILFLIALFFIPPQSPTTAVNKPGASRGFKVTIGIIIAVFLIMCIAVGVGLSH